MSQLSCRSFPSINSMKSAPRLGKTVVPLNSSRLFSTDQELRESPGSVGTSQPTSAATSRRLYLKSNPFPKMRPNCQYHEIDMTVRLHIPNPFAKSADSANIQKENHTTAKSDVQKENHTTAAKPDYAMRLMLVLIGCGIVYCHWLHATTYRSSLSQM